MARRKQESDAAVPRFDQVGGPTPSGPPMPEQTLDGQPKRTGAIPTLARHEVQGQTDDPVPVRLLVPIGHYNSGEGAVFPRARALALVDQGLAEFRTAEEAARFQSPADRMVRGAPVTK